MPTRGRIRRDGPPRPSAEELIARVRLGSECSIRDAGLDGAQLAGLKSEGLDLYGCRFRDADLSGSRLASLGVMYSDASRASLRGIECERFTVRSSCARDVDLSSAKVQLGFEGVSLVDLAGSRCDGSIWTQMEAGDRVTACSFAAASLRSARFKRVCFLGCDFTDADLHDARFDSCRLLRCRFDDAALDDAVFNRTALHGSDFGAADVSRARFDGCQHDALSVFERGAPPAGTRLVANASGTGFGEFHLYCEYEDLVIWGTKAFGRPRQRPGLPARKEK